MTKHMKTMDGNTAAAHVSYAFTEVAAIFPITPSSPMAEVVDEWSANGLKNIFGQKVTVTELQSEGGASGAVHGSLSAGILTTTYTASQGLLLMIPNMYKISGELLPGVFHVSARALASHALSIFGDHSDVMSARQTGFALLCSGSVQEVMDLGGIAHLAAIKSKVPFLHFFDGFRTSHEIQKIEVLDFDVLGKLLDKDALADFRSRALDPNKPITKGTAQNPDIFFQMREASNKFYNAVPQIVVDYMKEISNITGREYHPFNYYGAPDAENIIVAMGSVTEATEEVIDYLTKQGKKVGIIKVHLYRPWVKEYFLDAMPKTVKKIAVLDRTKEPGAPAEPLHLDVQSVFYDEEKQPVIVGGRYGLGSKDVTPTDILTVFENLELDKPKNNFTISIEDDVTNLSLPVKHRISVGQEGTIRCKFWGLGSDGTVGANKQAIKIIGDHTDMYAQGYFAYDSKKSGGVTTSHLRFGSTPIKSTYLIDEADFIACHVPSYVKQYDVIKGLKKGGKFVLNCPWSDAQLEEELPAHLKKYIAENDIDFYTISANKLADEIGLGSRINMIMQSGFFKLADVIPYDDAVKYLKESIVKSYGKKGQSVVDMNYKAVDMGSDGLHKVDVPAAWASLEDLKIDTTKADDPEYIKNILRPVNAQEGDSLPVSTFVGREDGAVPSGASAYEKRGIAVHVPVWVDENCIQCNQCSFVCPHAAIRPFLLTEEEKKNAPADFTTLKAIGKGLEGMEYRIQVSPMDCTGCGNCADVCPGKKDQKALVMTSFEKVKDEYTPLFQYGNDVIGYKDDIMDRFSVKGSQFMQPLLEFSGACAGCGETPYAKTITQLFGDRMMIANATGCSSIWGGSAPVSVYTKNKDGRGPAWANSLFEDNAEYGYGMAMGVKAMRNRIASEMKQLLDMDIAQDAKDAFNAWIDGMNSAEDTFAKKDAVIAAAEKISGEGKELAQSILDHKDYLDKKSVWIFGGDGWAYDIGYGGLDHVLASGEDINVMVFDTEIYSNTGGQSSKSTPTSAVAKFAASGKRVKKKDLGMMAATYGYVYVAQVAIGANKNHFLKVLKEAESYHGPSLIIAYAPCISHGLKEGMGRSIANEGKAVDAGYWHLYRYNPLLAQEGKNPFTLDSKEPKASFREFIDKQTRFSSLKRSFPEIAEELYARSEQDAKEKYEKYKHLAEVGNENI
nr:pyruvate:ferredoxin (flavodoxin) oxidoreductase [uncultured Criibacterium sp.]